MKQIIFDRIVSQYQVEWFQRFGSNFKTVDLDRWHHDFMLPRLKNTIDYLPTTCKNLLEVGIGIGLMHNYFLSYPGYHRVTGVDIEINSGFVELSDQQDIQCMRVEKLLFDDCSFDLVVCLHVLEHLNTQDMLTAIDNLRRVCSKNLIIGLPINEPPERLSLTNHCQVFDLDRLQSLFPTAEILSFDYPNLPGIGKFGGYAIIKELYDHT